MTIDYDAELRRVTRGLSDVAHALESVEDASARIERTLVLTREIVPCTQAALHHVVPSVRPDLFVAPAASEEERVRLTRMLRRIFNLVAEAEEIGRGSGERPSLALPVIGLDKVVGVLCLQHDPGFSYEARHLRLLSVVAAQLGAYLTIIDLRAAEAAQAAELATAHDFQQLLLGIVSHDLRNPLSVITMTASQLLATTKDEQQARSVERALRNARRATRIIADLLDVTRIRVSGELPIAKGAVDLHALVADLIDDVRLAGRRIEVIATGEEIVGDWDADRLSQVASNLVNNALQYGDPSEPVVVRLSSDAEGAHLTVHNSGAAIPNDLLPNIFDPFKRGASSAHRPGSKQGLGLGLFIVDQVVRAHGGTVTATSSVADGTTFVVHLPRRAAAEVVDARRPGPPGPTVDGIVSAKDGDQRPLVMVVDDDEDLRAQLASVLDRSGYAVLEANDGAEALEWLREGKRPRLILLDLVMPVMDGEAFYEACRADPALADIPILIISADVANAMRLARSPATTFLAKPVAPESLLQTIAHARSVHRG